MQHIIYQLGFNRTRKWTYPSFWRRFSIHVKRRHGHSELKWDNVDHSSWRFILRWSSSIVGQHESYRSRLTLYESVALHLASFPPIGPDVPPAGLRTVTVAGKLRHHCRNRSIVDGILLYNSLLSPDLHTERVIIKWWAVSVCPSVRLLHASIWLKNGKA